MADPRDGATLGNVSNRDALAGVDAALVDQQLQPAQRELLQGLLQVLPVEAKLGEAKVQRGLAAFEPKPYAAAGARAPALVPTP